MLFLTAGGNTHGAGLPVAFAHGLYSVGTLQIATQRKAIELIGDLLSYQETRLLLDEEL